MNLQDQTFLDYKEAVETFLRMGFEFTAEKRLILNCSEVVIKKVGTDVWRASIVSNKYEANP